MENTRQVAFDIGNSYIKVGVFEALVLIEKKTFEHHAEVEEWMKSQHFHSGIFATVKQELFSLAHFPLLQFGEAEVKMPVQNLYKTPKTLGKDRLAGVVGAKAMFPQEACLVIDMGTCITFDIVTERADFLGGAISPGLQMRLKAMHHFTANLPQADVPSQEVALIGTDTLSCLQSGAVNGIRFELKKAIEKYRSSYPNLKVLLCGGDAEFFESKIKEDIFAFPDLVLHGLNHTLLYHNAHL